MKHLPKVRIDGGLEARRGALTRWLDEWAIDCALSAEDELADRGTHDESSPSDGEVQGSGTAEPLAVGQVRLLWPGNESAASRPRYVAVLTDGRAGPWLAVPFGRFATPALPGEWLTGREAPALRVLCIWNAREVPEQILMNSWVVENLSSSEVETAMRVRAAIVAGEDLPSSLSGQVGPPLEHPLDPRHEYVAQETDWMDCVCSVGKPRISYLREPGDQSAGLRMAAEERGKYGTRTEPSERGGAGPEPDSESRD